MSNPRAPTLGEKVADEKKPRSVTVVLSGQEVVIHKMNIMSMKRLVKTAEPYLSQIAKSIIGGGRVSREEAREDPIGVLGRVLNEEALALLAQFPDDFMKMYALLLNIDEETDPDLYQWFMYEVDPEEALAVFPEVEELNDFKAIGKMLVSVFQTLGKRYKIGLPPEAKVELVEEQPPEEKKGKSPKA